MINNQRIEDLLPAWRKACERTVPDTAIAITDVAIATLPAHGHANDPVQQAAISEAINAKVGQLAVDELLPQCLGWLTSQELGPLEKDTGRVRAESAIAIRLRLPVFQAHLPVPTCRIPYRSWVFP